MSSPNAPHQFSNHSASIIQKIPVEILTMIFSYVGPPSAEKPYVYFPLSWVCRQWRSLILDNPKFWTVLRYTSRPWSENPDFTREIFRRSKSYPLDILTCRFGCPHPNGCVGRYVISEFSRIKSLCIRNFSLFESYSPTLQCPESFPQLENAIFDNTSLDTMQRVLLASRLRFIQISCETLLREEMSQNLSHVEWFKFHCAIGDSLCLLRFFQVLQHLPKLRILNISFMTSTMSESYDQDLGSLPNVTLPNLRMLSLDLWYDQFYSIRTPPALDYVGLSRFSRKAIHDLDFLDRIDLSTKTNLRVILYDLECRSTYISPKSLIVRIIMEDSDDDDDDDNNSKCQVFEKFHREISSATLSSMESHLVLPPKNTFYIELHNSGNIDMALSNQLKGAVNLVQLTLDYQSCKSDSDNITVASQLLSTLDTVTHLKVLRCRNFSVICDILTKKGNVPRLERITYHSSCKPINGPAFVLKRLRMMKNARVKFGCVPLKILEMRNFVVFSSLQVEKIERMGIQFVQVSS